MDERIDDLQLNGLKIIQKPNGFCFGMDAVLLANYVSAPLNSRIIDLGTGTGIIPILLSAKTNASKIIGVEIQKEMADLAKKSIALNCLEEKIEIHEGDLKNAVSSFSAASFDVVVTNPPYTKIGGGLLNPKSAKAVSRHEIHCTLEDVLKTASKLLKQYGVFFMIHRAERLVDVISIMRQYKIEPKSIKFIHPQKNKNANLFLIKGSKCGKSQIIIEKPLFVYKNEKEFSDDLLSFYKLMDSIES